MKVVESYREGTFMSALPLGVLLVARVVRFVALDVVYYARIIVQDVRAEPLHGSG